MTPRTTRRTLLALAAALPAQGLLPAALRAETDPRLAEIVLGSPDAPVEIIEYASLTCPHCARFHAEVFPRIKDAYIDTGKARFVFREVYFDRHGLWATMVARCEPDRYLGIVGEVFRTQAQWRSTDDKLVAENLRRIARLAAIPDERINACLADQAYANALVGIYREHAQRDRVDATPTFLVNGERQSYLDFAAFAALIEAKLPK